MMIDSSEEFALPTKYEMATEFNAFRDELGFMVMRLETMRDVMELYVKALMKGE